MNILKSSLVLTGMTALLFCNTACTDWGESDPEAGNQVFPSREATGSFTVKGLTSIADADFITATTGNAEIVYDNDLFTEVLHMDHGTVTISNPLNSVKLQTGAGLAFWVKTDGSNPDSRLFTFAGADGEQPVSFTASGKLVTPTGTVEVAPTTRDDVQTQLLEPDTWYFLGVQINSTGCTVYRDGELVASTAYAADAQLLSLLNYHPYIILGDEQGDLCMERIGVVRNSMNNSDLKRPNISKVVKLPDPVYFTDFETSDGLTIVGAGQFAQDATPGFGRVFQNAASTAPRTNYLLLPNGILSHSTETKEMTITFWVSAAEAGTTASYAYAPLFGAYGKSTIENGGNNDNNWPVFVLQSRGFAQLNCAGWTNLDPAQNVDGKNHVYNEFAWEANDASYIKSGNWLEDQKWHLYTITLTETEVTIMMDAEVKNQWVLDGSEGQTVTGLFSNGGDFGYICLGGNQAWSWSDNDGGFAFDDFAVYNEALSTEQVQKIISDKSGGSVLPTDLPEAYYRNTFEEDGDRALTIVGTGEWIQKTDNHGWVFSNNTSTAPRQNYLLLPEDLLAHSAETQQLTISFWVNASKCGESAEYLWAPLFMAYAQKNVPNTWPMLACQYRGVLQLNNAGWTDYADGQNTAGVNTLYHGDADWLADKEWHLYTVVFSGENAKVYLDGKIANEWVATTPYEVNGEKITGTTQAGLYSNGGDLKYICLGGNQAWDWNDNDAAFEYDDLMCFDTALTAAQIQALMSVYK